LRLAIVSALLTASGLICMLLFFKRRAPGTHSTAAARSSAR
jgi:hypothetical protein